jgi:peptidoglycan glycosyltransferase
MNGPIRRVVYGLFVGLALLLVATTYIQAIASGRYRTDPANSRVLIAENSKERGSIVDRNGILLATSEESSATRRTFTRKYPLGSLTAHPIGYSTVLFGERGIEEAYSSELRSRQDLSISDILIALFGGDLRPESLRLTLDAPLQQAAADALGERPGTIVALDPATGAVLAWVVRPTYDPARITDPAYASELEGDPTSPLLDRAREALYPPASTFKLVVAAEALDAIARSCNVPFAALALQLEATAVQERAELFGFNAELPFDLDTVASVVPDHTDDPAARAQSAIGERSVRATPLQMALVAATIANGGEVLSPYLVDAVFDADGKAVEVTDPTTIGRAISTSTAAFLSEAMVLAVEEGTATRAGVGGIRIAGKTGTSEAGSNPPVWFVGFAPADNPTIAIAILVEGGGVDGSGGSIAAPMARQVFRHWLLDE